MLKIIFHSLIVLPVIFLPSLYAGGGGAAGGSGSLGIEFTEIKLTLMPDSIISEGGSEKLSRGFYDFIVLNKSDDKLEFVIQELNTDKVFKKVSLNPGKKKSIRLKIKKNGIRYSASNIDQWYRYELN